MDPLTALSLAGSLVQFVDFTLKILTTGYPLYKASTGSLSAHEELKCVARDLSGLAKRLSHAQRSYDISERSQAEVAIEDLRGKCEIVAQELMGHLGTLKMQEKKGPLKNFRSALKATWDQNALNTLVQKLQFLRKSLESWFLVDFR